MPQGVDETDVDANDDEQRGDAFVQDLLGVDELLEEIREGVLFGATGAHVLLAALEHESDHAEGFAVAGFLLVDFEPERAQLALERALELEPGRADAQAGLAAVAWALGDETAAESRARAAINDGADAYETLGMVCEASGRIDEAAACFLTGFEGDPGRTHLLERYCELHGVPYRDPGSAGEELSGRWAAIDPLTRCRLYTDVLQREPDGAGGFEGVARWAREQGIVGPERAALYVMLGTIGIRSDADVAQGARFDVATLLVRVTGEVQGRAAAGSPGVSGALSALLSLDVERVQDLEDDELVAAPLGEPPPAVAARVADDGTVTIVPQTLRGIDAARWVEAAGLVITGGASGWLAARPLRGQEGVIIAEFVDGRHRLVAVDSRTPLDRLSASQRRRAQKAGHRLKAFKLP